MRKWGMNGKEKRYKAFQGPGSLSESIRSGDAYIPDYGQLPCRREIFSG